MYNPNGQLRPAFKDDWLARHQRRERMALKYRWVLTRFCKRCGIECVLETIERHGHCDHPVEIKRFLFCRDGEVVTWEPFDGLLRFEPSGREQKIYTVKMARRALMNHWKLIDSRKSR